jgi:hypothetical protein
LEQTKQPPADEAPLHNENTSPQNKSSENTHINQFGGRSFGKLSEGVPPPPLSQHAAASIFNGQAIHFAGDHP